MSISRKVKELRGMKKAKNFFTATVIAAAPVTAEASLDTQIEKGHIPPSQEMFEQYVVADSAEANANYHEFLQKLIFDNDELYILTHDEAFKVADMVKRQEERHEFRRSQRKAYRKAPKFPQVDTVKIGIDDMRGALKFGSFDTENKQITLNVFEKNYNKKDIMEWAKDKLGEADISLPVAAENILAAELIPELESEADSAFQKIIKRQLKGTYHHEKTHLENDKMNIYAPGISPLQAAKLNQHDEITATVNDLLYLREEYKKNGDLQTFRDGGFDFYANALKNSEISPGTKEERAFIVHGVTHDWLKNNQSVYHNQLISVASAYAESFSAANLQENQKEYLKRLAKIYNNIKIDGKKSGIDPFVNKDICLNSQTENIILHKAASGKAGMDISLLRKANKNIHKPDDLAILQKNVAPKKASKADIVTALRQGKSAAEIQAELPEHKTANNNKTIKTAGYGRD